MEKYRQAKVKHHYVWSDYLKNWSSNSRDIYYTTARGKIAYDSVRGIAMENHFYRVGYLNKTHIQIIKAYSSHSPEHLQEQHIAYLNDFLGLQDREATYNELGLKSEEIDKILNASRSNILENLHSAHEGAAQRVISSLKKRDLTVLDAQEDMILFFMFLGQQLTRTKNFKDASIRAIGNTSSVGETDPGINLASLMEECWWFLSYMFGINIGASLFMTRNSDAQCLLVNETDTPFITSDQPIINVHKALKNDQVVTLNDDECDFYYPLSPDVAYAIINSDQFDPGINFLTENVVKELNIKMARRANVTLIGSNRRVLKSLKNFVGQRISH